MARRAVGRDPDGEPSLAWGIDLGGTDCKVGIVDSHGRALAQTGFPTLRDPAAAVAAIEEACRRLAAEADVRIGLAGMGAPGPLDLDHGMIIQAPNLGWRDVPLRDMVAAALGCPVVLDNDANAAAYGEAWVGAGRGTAVLLLATLGTGVGGGVVAGGRVFHGARGLAVELGHQVIVPEGRPCSCGKRGCLEAYFSGHAFDEQALETIGARDGRPTHKELFERYAAGDPLVAPWMEEALDVLARGVAQAGVLFDPDAIVFTGGLTRSWDIFGARLVESIVRRMGPAGPLAQGIVLTALGGDAGIIGAAGLALREDGRESS
jgi:glucokinase